MNKSLLVIDTPTKCGSCPLCYKDNGCMDSYFTYRCGVSNDKVPFEEIYENCPLRHVPVKMEGPVDDFWQGYNYAIYDIFEKSEE